MLYIQGMFLYDAVPSHWDGLLKMLSAVLVEIPLLRFILPSVEISMNL